MLTDEGMRNAAARAESAAEDIRRAAGHIDENARKIEMLVSDGYGNNVTKLFELLEADRPDLMLAVECLDLIARYTTDPIAGAKATEALRKIRGEK